MADYNFSFICAKFISSLASMPAILFMIFADQFILKQKNWQPAVLLMLFVISWNSILKYLIGVQLMPPMLGYAIPSGHTHLVASFYGYMAYCYKDRMLGKLIFLSIVAFGWSLIKLHYHSLIDVSVALAFASVEIYLMHNFFRFQRLFMLEISTIILILSYAIGHPEYCFPLMLGTAAYTISQGLDRQSICWLLGLWLFILPEITFNQNNIILFVLVLLIFKTSQFEFGPINVFSRHHRSQ